MEEHTKQRIIGAAVLIALAAIFIPIIASKHEAFDKISTNYEPPAAPRKPVVTMPKINQAPIRVAQQIKIDNDFQPPRVAHVNLTPNEHPQLIAAKPEPMRVAILKPLPRKPVAKPATKLAHKSIPKKIKRTITKPKVAVPKAIKTPKRSFVINDANPHKIWIVQLASFSNSNNAKKLARRLRAKGFKAYTRTTKNIKGNFITRLLVGPASKRQQANQLAARLQKTFKIRGIVIASTSSRA